jgi:hypothetical protein
MRIFNKAAYVDDLARLVENMLVAAALGKPARIDVAPPRQPGFTISSDYASRVFGYRARHISDMVQRYATEYFVGLGGIHLLRSDQLGHA